MLLKHTWTVMAKALLLSLLISCEMYNIEQLGRGFYNVAQEDSTYLDVFILAGQSNMIAVSEVVDQTIPGYNTELEFGYIWNPDNDVFELINPGVNSSPVWTGGHTADVFGPETSFAKDLAVAVGRDIYIIKQAIGASQLEESAVINDWSEKSTGEYLDGLKGIIDNADAHVKTLNKSIRIKGIFWAQGENDVQFSTLYYQNLINFIENLRAYCIAINKANGVSVDFMNIIYQLSTKQDYPQPGLNEVKQAQADYVTNFGDVLVITESYDLLDTNHFDADGIIQIGQQAATGSALIYN